MWNIGTTNSRVTVTLEKNGVEIKREFDGTILVKDAVIAIARENGIKNFVVENESNSEISESQGSQTLSSVGNLVVLPETVGAEEETGKTEEPAKEEEAKTSEDD